MVKHVSLGLALLLGSQTVTQTPSPKADKTSFQVDQPWSPAVDVRADRVLLYGIGDDFPARAASWKGKGIPLVLVLGPEELAAGMAKIKIMKTGEKKTLALSEVVAALTA